MDSIIYILIAIYLLFKYFLIGSTSCFFQGIPISQEDINNYLYIFKHYYISNLPLIYCHYRVYAMCLKKKMNLVLTVFEDDDDDDDDVSDII